MNSIQQLLPLRFLRRIRCSAVRVREEQLLLPLPGVPRHRETSPEDDHHLRRKPNGYYQLRVTIDRGPKLVGLRKTFGLDTRDPGEARKRRDVVLKALKEAGHVIAEG